MNMNLATYANGLEIVDRKPHWHAKPKVLKEVRDLTLVVAHATRPTKTTSNMKALGIASLPKQRHHYP